MRIKNLKIWMLVIGMVAGLVSFAGLHQWFNKPEKLPLVDAQDVFRKLYSRFGDPEKKLHISGTVSLQEGSLVSESVTFEFFRDGHNVYHRFDGIQHISNKNVALQLDTVSQYLIITNPDKEFSKKQKAGILPFEALTQDTSSFKISAGNVNGEPSIEVINDFQPEVKSCSLVYDPDNFIIKRAIIHWWKQPGSIDNKEYWETIIDYQYHDNLVKDVEAMLQHVVTVTKRTVEVNAAYSNYQIDISEHFKK